MLLIAVAAMMATPALAAEYEFDDSDGPMYAPPTSVDQVIVVGGGATESSNIDRSKNTAVFAPPFGSPESYLPGAGTTLIPQASTSTGSTISGETIYLPPASYDDSTPAQDTSLSSNKFTLPDGLFYEDGSLGRLKIPSLGLSVKVYEDESLESLAKGAGHFKSTSCWDGNVGLAGHNRGVANHFGQIHTLEDGDKITYTTKLGTRTYEVFYVGQIEETDFSRLGRSSENMITLITAREVKTLEGYVLDTAPKSIEIKSGEVQTLRFYNSKQGTLVIRKLDSVTKEPLAGVEFELTYADGGYVDDANGHLSSLGLYTTDQNGEIRISGVTGTIVVKETKTISGYTIDPATQTQTVEVNPEDTQTLTFYNNPVGGVEILKVDANRTSKRIPNTTFEIRKIDDELIDTITTDKNGRAYLSLEDGAYRRRNDVDLEGDLVPAALDVEEAGTSG